MAYYHRQTLLSKHNGKLYAHDGPDEVQVLASHDRRLDSVVALAVGWREVVGA